MKSCFYCKLIDPKVECRGVHYCPNPRCPGPGATWFRATLKSYRPDGMDGHFVDADELEAEATKYENRKIVADAVSAQALSESFKKFVSKVPFAHVVAGYLARKR